MATQFSTIMNTVQLVVEKATPSCKGGFVVTLKTDVETAEPVIVKTPLGDQKRHPKLRTYYTKVEADLAEGTKIALDLDEYDVVPQPFTTAEGKDIDCKWLYLK